MSTEARRFKGMITDQTSPDLGKQIDIDITVRGETVRIQAPGIDIVLITALELRIFLQLCTTEPGGPEELLRKHVDEILKQLQA